MNERRTAQEILLDRIAAFANNNGFERKDQHSFAGVDMDEYSSSEKKAATNNDMSNRFSQLEVD